MRKCKVDGCDNKHHSNGYCNKHYQQYKKYGEGLAPPKEPKVCSAPNCNNKHYGKGYCHRHYDQYKTYGRILERTQKDPNEIVIYDDYAEIVLYNKNNIEVGRAIIDLEDINKVKDYKWHLNSVGYVYNNKVGLLHRFLMNPSNDKVIDHKNGNPLDNRKSNLRICSIQQNNMNVPKQKGDTTSQFKGVCFNKQNKKWQVQICINGKNKHIGYYDAELDASIEYDKKALLHFGVYACTNFPLSNYYDYIINDLGLNPNDFDIDTNNVRS